MSAGPRFLLDGGVSAGLMRRDGSLLRRLESLQPAQVAISSVTLSELAFGVAMSMEPELDREVLGEFLLHVAVLDYTREAAEAYGPIREGLHWREVKLSPHEMLLAAQARSLGLRVVSERARRFAEAPGVEAESWAG